MSRVAKNPINIPENVEFNQIDNLIKVKGSKGELELEMSSSLSLNVNESIITVEYDENDQESIAIAGTTRSLINNMVIGAVSYTHLTLPTIYSV